MTVRTETIALPGDRYPAEIVLVVDGDRHRLPVRLLGEIVAELCEAWLVEWRRSEFCARISADPS